MTIFSCLNLTAQDVVLKGNEAFIARQKLYCRNSEEEKTRYGSGKVELTADFLERDKHLFKCNWYKYQSLRRGRKGTKR